MTDPKQIIEDITDIKERIEVVAQDFQSGKNLFSTIKPYELAVLLGEYPEEFSSRTQCGHRASIDDFCDPLYHYFEYFVIYGV